MRLAIVITVIFLALSIELSAKHVRIRTDEGSVTIEAADPRDGKVRSEEVLNELKKRLARLGSRERADATKELRAIRVIVSALPRDGVVNVDDYDRDHDRHHRRGEVREMPAKDFQILLDNLKTKTFGSDRVAVIRIAAENNYFSMAQLQEMLRLGRRTDSSEMLEIVRTVYPRLTDRTNRYQLLDFFVFQSDKESAKRIMDEIDRK
jgi:hypothetical protein